MDTKSDRCDRRIEIILLMNVLFMFQAFFYFVSIENVGVIGQIKSTIHQNILSFDLVLFHGYVFCRRTNWIAPDFGTAIH